MQAVAEQLGVDRKAINYHVQGRDELLGLVANDAYGAALEHVVLPVTDDWRELLAALAHGLCGALVSTGDLAAHVKINGPGSMGPLRVGETCLAALLRAGFDPLQAGRATYLVVKVAHAAARDQLIRRTAELPETAAMQAALDARPSNDFVALRAVTGAAHAPDFSDLDFDVTVVIAGLEASMPKPRKGSRRG
jgi:TetR/AcrR family tetracycline transcriptional repressor